MTTEPRYPIPAKTTRVEIRVVNSRFIATIGEARSVEEARVFIDAIRGEFADATHNVYAFRVGYGGSVTEGMSDDGEPPGTAGRPALSVLRGADLGDVVLVITRYFGGTKLGTGGLVRAYTQSTQEALADLPRGERVERRSGQITLPYALYEQAKMLITAHGGDISKEDFAGEVTLLVVFPIDACSAFEAALAELSAGKVKIGWE
ncbi:MAG: YigZ family protein [Anaerolineae bacterium]|nr:YigZ family protein [Anaerolineae bacterium]